MGISVDQRLSWGWVTCKRTGWANDEKGKLYKVTFRAENDLYNYTITTILFWAKHPYLKLRDACKQDRSLDELHKFLRG